MKPPTRTELMNMLAENLYGGRILNNSHRGDLVEMLVLSALGPEWKFVGLGWHLWDLQSGSAVNRVRIQVKQSAALQIWGKTKNIRLVFPWKPNAPDYVKRDNPTEDIESEGWFCEIFVIGLHLEDDNKKADHVNPNQWKFIVIPVTDLNPKQKSMSLMKAQQKWKLVSWYQLSQTVDNVISKMGIKI